MELRGLHRDFIGVIWGYIGVTYIIKIMETKIATTIV